jgi:hypothetical protein
MEVRFPELLQVYTSMGEGGSGPGYGLPLVSCRAEPRQASVLDLYQVFSRADPRNRLGCGLVSWCRFVIGLCDSVVRGLLIRRGRGGDVRSQCTKKVRTGVTRLRRRMPTSRHGFLIGWRV